MSGFGTNAADRALGWPRLVGEVKGLKVRLRREVTTGMMTLPAGLEGVLLGSTAWHRLNFKGKACSCCGISGRVSGLTRNDLEVML